MTFKLNDKTTIEGKGSRGMYWFLYGYMEAIFEIRYTCKIETGAMFFIVTNMDGIYTATAYRVEDDKPVVNTPEYENIEDVLAIITGYRPRKKVTKCV